MSERVCPVCGGKVQGRSDKVFCSRRCHGQTPNAKATKRRYDERYRQTTNGKERQRYWQQRYRQSSHGKESARRRRQRYDQTYKGKECSRRYMEKWRENRRRLRLLAKFARINAYLQEMNHATDQT